MDNISKARRNLYELYFVMNEWYEKRHVGFTVEQIYEKQAEHREISEKTIKRILNEMHDYGWAFRIGEVWYLDQYQESTVHDDLQFHIDAKRRRDRAERADRGGNDTPSPDTR